MSRLIGVCLLLTLAGCGSTSTFYEWRNGVWEPKFKAETKGSAKTDIVLEDGKVKELHQDSKNEPIIKLEMPATKFGG